MMSMQHCNTVYKRRPEVLDSSMPVNERPTEVTKFCVWLITVILPNRHSVNETAGAMTQAVTEMYFQCRWMHAWRDNQGARTSYQWCLDVPCETR